MSRQGRVRRIGPATEELRQRPLYARVLRLRHLNPGGMLCFVFLEGAVALGLLLALAELVSWWGMLLLPVAVALMVKANDVVAGAVARSAALVPEQERERFRWEVVPAVGHAVVRDRPPRGAAKVSQPPAAEPQPRPADGLEAPAEEKPAVAPTGGSELVGGGSPVAPPEAAIASTRDALLEAQTTGSGAGTNGRRPGAGQNASIPSVAEIGDPSGTESAQQAAQQQMALGPPRQWAEPPDEVDLWRARQSGRRRYE